MTVEYMLARLTAQSPGPRPKDPPGTAPTLTNADVGLIAHQAPRMAWHALMAKYCGDQQSERALLFWAHAQSLEEWFANPQNSDTAAKPSQLKRIPELAVLTFVNPQCPHALSIGTRAAYAGCSHDIFRRNFQGHYRHLLGELELLEAIGLRAVIHFRGRRSDEDA